VSAAQFRENQRYMSELRADRARAEKNPRIHALISELWEAARQEPDKAKRDALEHGAEILQGAADRGAEIVAGDEPSWRSAFGLGVLGVRS
jgi:hypothetical protein